MAVTPVKDIPGIVTNARNMFEVRLKFAIATRRRTHCMTGISLPPTHPIMIDRSQAGLTRRIYWRKEQIGRIADLVRENKTRLFEALHADLGVNEFWAHGVELQSVLNEASEAIANVGSWAASTRTATPVLNLPARSHITPQPLGVACVISPWNYPVSLILNPLIAAIAAGNTVVLKPSEISGATSKLLAELIPKYLDKRGVRVVLGAVPETTALLAQRFDVIMYTGSSHVGKIVMAAAAKHLTPVILELGGKCPAIVADNANITETAQRIAWAKWTLNMGQTCVSPDYVLCTEKTEEKLVAALAEAVTQFFGDEPRKSADVSRIVNEAHTKRVAALLDDDDGILETVCGGAETVDVKACYIGPTIVRATKDAKLMEGEIFGPVLPVVRVASLDDAILHVQAGEKPLALYVFARDDRAVDRVLNNTSSGGACVNDCAMHAHQHLPFGGVGHSGMGAYHGKFGFDAFSHRRAVMRKRAGRGDPALRFAPYTASKLKWLGLIRSPNTPYVLGAAAVGALAGAGALGYQLFAWSLEAEMYSAEQYRYMGGVFALFFAVLMTLFTVFDF